MKDKFYAIYKILKNDEVIQAVFDTRLEVVKYLKNKINIQHFTQILKRNQVIYLDNSCYHVYEFKE